MANKIKDLLTKEERMDLLENDPYEKLIYYRGFREGILAGVALASIAITLGYWMIRL